MRNRLVISLALGVLVAVLAVGTVAAQNGDVSVDLPTGTTTDAAALPACSNGLDDDGDGIVDIADPGCDNPQDVDEVDVPVPADTSTSSTEPTTSEDETTEGETGSTGSTGSTDSTTTKEETVEGAINKPGEEKQKDLEKDFTAPEEVKEVGDPEVAEDVTSAEPVDPGQLRRPDGTPKSSNPTITIGGSGAAPIGVPNFIIDQFSIPPFLLPIYQACGTQYGIQWEILASINRIETAFGTNLNVSSAGAQGWMQFMPATWEMYGVDANNDGRKDPYNPVDAICAAARYLDAAGGMENLYDAIFAYNHADWYVEEVLLYAKQYGKLPSGLVDSVVGLTEGAHFPVAAKARYADDLSERVAAKRAEPRKGDSGSAADVISSSPTRRGINIYAKAGAPVVAVNDGVIVKTGNSKKLGRFVVLRDAYGNDFLYAGLGKVADEVPVPKREKLTAKDFELVSPGDDEKPSRAASTTEKIAKSHDEATPGKPAGKSNGGNEGDKPKDSSKEKEEAGPENTEDSRARVFANPSRAEAQDGELDEPLGKGTPGYETFKSYFSGVLEFDPEKMDTQPLRKGTRVAAGTILGEIGQIDPKVASNVHFEIAPAGRGAHTIDPKPILDGWKLLEATAIYRAAGKNPFKNKASVGEVLLASKSQLQRRVLANPRLEIYSCGRDDIKNGLIDRRIMAMLEYLAARGYRLTITSLICGHGQFTTSGNVSAHWTGDAVDIAMVNGLSILGNQGKGSITEAVINDLLKLQGTMTPSQIISLMEMGGPTFAMGDHADHIHVGYTPDGAGDDGQPLSGLLKPKQWDRLLDRIGELDQPTVPTKPSDAALPSKKGKKLDGRASRAHVGE